MNDVFLQRGSAAPAGSLVVSNARGRAALVRRWAVSVVLAMALLSPAWAQAAGEGEVLPGVSSAQLEADYWIGRLRDADRVILDREAIDAFNRRMRQAEPSLHDIERLPVTLEAAQVRAWIEQASPRPSRTLYDESGKPGSERALDKLVAALDLKAIPDTQVTRYGMVVRRADLRTFPTHLRVFSSPDDRDIDRFQESALFPGTPVAVVHQSRDRRWLFVISETYAAWIEAGNVAFGERAAIFAHARRTPFLVVTGATANTVYTPENAAASNVRLDMGVRLPLAQWPRDEPLNGQHPGFGHVVELPARNADGSLAFIPALVPRSADVSTDYLPLTKANLIRQGFKFLGERYGWGHRYDARDCSGFVSEVYRSFGILLPRNTSAQSRSPGIDGVRMDASVGHDERLRELRRSQVGDLVYIPGHVMMAIGHVDGRTWVIHDTAGGSWFGTDGKRVQAHLNGVSVTPLEPMMASDTVRYIDRITNIQRLRAKTAE